MTSITEWPLWRAFLAPFAAIPRETIRAVLGGGGGEEVRRWALIAEPRPHALLVAVVKHVAALLGPLGWGVVVMHGKASAEGLRAALPSAPRLVLVEMPVDDLPLAGYSALLLKPFVWRNLVAMGARQVLIFQTDALVLSPARVDEFAEAGWDYVGAPWSEGAWGEGRAPTHPVGNGGFSLRDPATMLRVAEALEAGEGEGSGSAGREGAAAAPWERVAREVRDSGAPEDVVFSRACVEMGARVPSAEVASSFAAETIRHPDPGGLHNPSSLAPNDLMLYLARRWDLVRLAAAPRRAPRLLRLDHPRDYSPPEHLAAQLARADELFARGHDPEAALAIYARAYRNLLRLVAGIPHPEGAPAAATLLRLHAVLRRTLSYCWAPPPDLLADLPAPLCRAAPPAWPAPHERPDPKKRLQSVVIGDQTHVIEVGEEAEEGWAGPGERKIRLGYVGPDFNRNAVGLFAAALLSGHDPARFDVFVYSTAASADDVTAHLRGCCGANVTWVEAAHLSDDALADLMRRVHRLDILVDLIAAGVGGRPDLVARRPAPAVVNYLGFPERVGLPGLYTHRISDPLAENSAAPRQGRGGPAALPASAERIVLLREAPFVCYSHWESVYPSPPIAPRAPPGCLTRAGLFARSHKHHPRLRDIFASALAASPSLRLVLKDDAARPLGPLYPAARFPNAAFLPFSDSHSAFMDRFNDIDFLADSQPYSGTTITCAALHMGVPVLSVLSPANRHVSHVSAALMLHVQRALDAMPHLAAKLPARLDDTFVARSTEEYAQRLVSLGAQDQRWWGAWRRARGAIAAAFRAAMDPARFVADLESAYESMLQS